MTVVDVRKRHPARWSSSIVAKIDEILNDERAQAGTDLVVFDPFAGVGLRFLRNPDRIVFGSELEHEWATAGGPGMMVADATRLPLRDESVDVICTSPTYGNRMADLYDGSRDTCTQCAGTGREGDGDGATCGRCAGVGLASSARRTYRIALGHDLTDGSSAGLQWRRGKAGRPYRKLHAAAWSEAWRVLRPGGLAIVNVSNHIRGGVEQHVTEWHLSKWLELGALLDGTVPVRTPGARFGANHDLRTPFEWLLLLRKPSR